MKYIWRLCVIITLFVVFCTVSAELSNPINFSAVLSETVGKFQLQG